MKGKRAAFAAIAALLLLASARMPLFAQRSAGEDANIDPLYLIDTPIAGVLPATSGAIQTFLYPRGGVLTGLVYSPFRNLNAGIFYGGTNLIGEGEITWNNLPGFMLRYRFMEEDETRPAIVAGFDSQGRDGYIPADKQYAVKSPGFFLCASKNYGLLGFVSFHGGMNYTLERSDGDDEVNFFAGLEKTIGSRVSFLAEYSFWFDNDKGEHGFWNGGLALGARVSTNIGFNIDVVFKNLLTSSPYYGKTLRCLTIQYVRYI